jgi:hypothetical protein
MVDRRREQDVNEAAARFAETLAESYRIVYEQAADAQQRQGRLAQDFSERVMDHLREQAEGGRAASERLTDQARRQQEAGQAFAQESAKAYMDFPRHRLLPVPGRGTPRAAESAQSKRAVGSRSRLRRGEHRGTHDGGPPLTSPRTRRGTPQTSPRGDRRFPTTTR